MALGVPPEYHEQEGMPHSNHIAINMELCWRKSGTVAHQCGFGSGMEHSQRPGNQHHLIHTIHAILVWPGGVSII